jgi:hypothetical protein
MADESAGTQANVKRLLTWATFLAVIALAVLGLDVMIKNQILAASKDADLRLGALRKETQGDGRGEGPAGGSHDQAADRVSAARRFAVGDDPGSPAESNGHAGGADVPEVSPAPGDSSGS